MFIQNSYTGKKPHCMLGQPWLQSINFKHLLCSEKVYPSYLELKPVQKIHHLVITFFLFFLKKKPTEKAKPRHSLLGLLVQLGVSYTKKLKCKTMHGVVRISVLFTGCISEGILIISPVFKSKGFLMQDILIISSSTLVASGTGNFANK